MQCSEEEALARLFYNVSSSFLLILLLLDAVSDSISGLLRFLGAFSLFRREQTDNEYGGYSDEGEAEEEEEEEEVEEPQHSHGYFRVSSMGEADLVADIIHGGEALSFFNAGDDPYETFHKSYAPEESGSRREVPAAEETSYAPSQSSEQFSAQDFLACDGVETSLESDDEEIPARDSDQARNSVSLTEDVPLTPVMLDRYRNDHINDIPIYDEISEDKEGTNDLRGSGRLITTVVPEVAARKFQGLENDFEEAYGDSCTTGSTSKSSSEWRSSTINLRDSGTEDPFSSSSRRSCPKWESYTVFQKYDEEMMFFDRISAQKLHETESLRSIKVQPRSISERIVHKISTGNKRQPSDFRRNPYHELEAAYVAEICLTWEALNWNYMSFQSKRASKARDIDPGCPARVAQQFQQFQVLLQRYIENEPYEQGRRPEVYARMRLLAPKLLQVPEYRDSEDDNDQKEEGFRSRISSAAFLMIMEDGIRTFMNFLKADKVKACQAIASFFTRNRRGSVDPTLLALMKKVNKKKKAKLKDMRRAGRCIRKKKLSVEVEMEILLGLIDLKVVSRVLRTGDLSEEQLHWCEEKMSKVKFWQGKLQRESSPLFFPQHPDPAQTHHVP